MELIILFYMFLALLKSLL